MRTFGPDAAALGRAGMATLGHQAMACHQLTEAFLHILMRLAVAIPR